MVRGPSFEENESSACNAGDRRLSRRTAPRTRGSVFVIALSSPGEIVSLMTASARRAERAKMSSPTEKIERTLSRIWTMVGVSVRRAFSATSVKRSPRSSSAPA